MNAKPEAKQPRDFSSAAVWRGSIAAMVAGYFMSSIVLATLAGSATGFQVDLTQAFYMLPYTLAQLLNPILLMVALLPMVVVLVVGYFVMGAYQGDYTTYRAAAIIGARTAAIILAFPLFLMVLAAAGELVLHGLPNIYTTLYAILSLLAVCALVLGAGAITGLAARWAAGAPTVEPPPETA